MRRLMIFLCVAAIAGLGFATISTAGIVGTAHEYNTAAGGTCARCHLPHGASASADRLWIATPSASGITNVGEVAVLCSYCHADGGGGDVTASATSWIWGLASHGIMMSATDNPYSQVDYTGTSGLPYYTDANDTNIECTTCHDVHNDPTGGTGFRPFLRADLDDLCSSCHGLRRFEDQAAWTGTTGSTGNWSADDSHYGDGNRMTHPVGDDVTTDTYDPGDSPITLALPFNAARVGTLKGWAMGGHLSSGGGVTCVTCHAVHGVQTDGGVSMTDSAPYPNMLVLSQGSGYTDAQSRTVANGGGSWNRLCEACHDGTVNASYNVSTTNPDPGGTGYGHPVDDMERSGLQNWVDAADFPANWPTGDVALKNGALTPDPIVVCESCHVAHPNANLARNDNSAAVGFTISQYILRTSRTAICGECHGDLNAVNHHPVGTTFDQVGTAAGYLINVDSATTGQTLSCVTCHTGTGAHNWSASGAAGLDTNWLPADNGRGDGTRAQDQYDVALGRTCMDCHYNLTAANGISPTKNDGTAEGTPDYNTLGSATHFIGALGARYGGFTTHAAYWATTGAVNGNIETFDWGAGAWSRFGNTTANPVLVCESCHELEPDKNEGTAHLLLDTYVEGDTAATTSTLCEGCHYPTGTHPTTGDTVTRADPDRALSTTFATIDWLFDPSVLDTNLEMGADIMTCDTCHQPHDAATNSATFILDVDNANLGTAVGSNYSEAGSYTNALGYVTAYQDGKGGNHQSFCNVCHTYE